MSDAGQHNPQQTSRARGEEPNRARGDDPLPARDAAAWIAARLAAAGHKALFAGGCVRDRLLGISPADFDVATAATPDQIKAIFPKAMGVGEAFGVMLVRYGGRTVEVATFRSDGPYDDGRRPNQITFADDRHDALRRDFTVNGLFEDPVTGAVIDYVDGQADLKARRLRAIGDARERFREDRLRTLRAVRFAARFDLAIEPSTLEAVRAFAHDLAGVSRERIGNEVRRMLAHPTRARAVELCEELGLAPVILQEPPVALDSATLKALPSDAAISTALAAWMLGRGTSPDDRSRVVRWRTALMLSNEETDELIEIFKLRSKVLAGWSSGDAAARKRMASSSAFTACLQLLHTSHLSLAQDVARDVAVLAQTGLAPEPFITGDDLVRSGLSPGPAFRPILDRLYDQQLNGLLTSREQALQAVSQLKRDS